MNINDLCCGGEKNEADVALFWLDLLYIFLSELETIIPTICVSNTVYNVTYRIQLYLTRTLR
jgi:hypothetical protein